MSKDPRLIATRNLALDTAKKILMDKGVLHISYLEVSKATGISRSTLYRHWSSIDALRIDVFKQVATPAKIAPQTQGPLHKDLMWIFGILISVLNETSWGVIAPQIIGIAATEKEAKKIMNQWMESRIDYVIKIFKAAEKRGEIKKDTPIRQIVELAIAGIYYRKLMLGKTLDQKWLKSHIDLLCRLAGKN